MLPVSKLLYCVRLEFHMGRIDTTTYLLVLETVEAVAAASHQFGKQLDGKSSGVR